MSALEVGKLNAHHGLLHAVRDVSFSVASGEIVALVGANGAGKTTLLRSVAGAHRVTSGSVALGDTDITGTPSYRRVAMGVALVPEGRKLFARMTVEENLRVGQTAGRAGRWNLERVLEVFPNLKDRRSARAGTLSGGEQQATAIGRALMSNPAVLLLDEVSLGLSPQAVDRVYNSLTHLVASKTTIVLVEQDLGRVMRVASRIICLLEGQVALAGATAALTPERITEAYFGVGSRQRAGA